MPVLASGQYMMGMQLFFPWEPLVFGARPKKPQKMLSGCWRVLGTWGPVAALLSPSCSLTWLLSFLISLLLDAYSSREN